VLPASARQLQERDPRAATSLAAALGADDLAAAVSELLAALGAAVRLRDLGLPAAALPEAADLLAADSALDSGQASALLAAAW
jgi:hypothetical protein